MNKNLTYFAFVHQNENGLWCEFPDLENCMTDGDNLKDLLRNAVDCLESYMIGMQELGLEMPIPSNFEELKQKKADCEDEVVFTIPVTGYMPDVPVRINVTSTASKIDEITEFAKKIHKTRSELMVDATLEYIHCNA